MKTSFRLFTAVASLASLAAAIVACSAPAESSSQENLGQQQEAICLNYPCIPPSTGIKYVSSSSGMVATSSGTVYVDPTFTCKGKVAGTAYYYEIQPDGQCAIVDPYGCKDAGGGSPAFVATPDGGCYGSTVISYYICPVNKPNLSCNVLTSVCTCY